VEINLIPNAPTAAEANVLMDGPEKPAGLAHFGLLCADLNLAIDDLHPRGCSEALLGAGGGVRKREAAPSRANGRHIVGTGRLHPCLSCP
jgi:hypothetical protein